MKLRCICIYYIVYTCIANVARYKNKDKVKRQVNVLLSNHSIVRHVYINSIQISRKQYNTVSIIYIAVILVYSTNVYVLMKLQNGGKVKDIIRPCEVPYLLYYLRISHNFLHFRLLKILLLVSGIYLYLILTEHTYMKERDVLCLKYNKKEQ